MEYDDKTTIVTAILRHENKLEDFKKTFWEYPDTYFKSNSHIKAIHKSVLETVFEKSSKLNAYLKMIRKHTSEKKNGTIHSDF